MSWRGWLAFAGVGSALALACRSDWVAAGAAAAAVLVPVVFWVRGEFAATRAMLHGLAEMSEVAAACPAGQMKSVTGTSAHATES